MDLFLTNTQLFSSRYLNWWTLDYCDVFIRLSFWRHPFTAEHPLLRHWCNAFLPIWWRNKLLYILDGMRVITFNENYICGELRWKSYEKVANISLLFVSQEWHLLNRSCPSHRFIHVPWTSQNHRMVSALHVTSAVEQIFLKWLLHEWPFVWHKPQ